MFSFRNPNIRTYSIFILCWRLGESAFFDLWSITTTLGTHTLLQIATNMPWQTHHFAHISKHIILALITGFPGKLALMFLTRVHAWCINAFCVACSTWMESTWRSNGKKANYHKDLRMNVQAFPFPSLFLESNSFFLLLKHCCRFCCCCCCCAHLAQNTNIQCMIIKK